MPVPDKHINRLKALARRVVHHVQGFYLAGGTALMFRHRHRMSTDLDFFREHPFSFRHLVYRLRRRFPIEQERQQADSLDIWIEGVRVSFVFFPFRNIDPLVEEEGIPMASDYDIYLNKIYAAGRRIEPKDPWDFVMLTERYQWPWDRVRKDFEIKFPDQSFDLSIGAILNLPDYPDLPREIQEKLTRIAREVARWRLGLS